MEKDNTTIRITNDTWLKLTKLKTNPSQTYDEVILNLITGAK